MMKPKFDVQQPLPVIIGTGLTGMAASRTLSAKGIRHILIGAIPQPNMARLGESINLEATLDLKKLFPEYQHYYFPKSGIALYRRNFVTFCPLDAANYPAIANFLKLIGLDAPAYVYHIDRREFDVELFHNTIASDYCTFINDKVVDVAYDPNRDVVTQLRLSGEAILEPAYVFDVTNHLRLLPRLLNIDCELLGNPQKLIFTHYQSPAYSPQNNSNQTQHFSWSHITSIVRLDQTIDEIDGIAWCIPMGEYISVGISMDAADIRQSDEEIMTLLKRAYCRRGIDYSTYYQQETKLISGHYQNYIHSRAYGTNWLLLGGTYAQYWFMTSSGVATALYGACSADKFLRHPQKMAQNYETYSKSFVNTHRALDKIIAGTGQAGIFSSEEVDNFFGSFVLSTVRRLCMYSQTRNAGASSVVAGIVRFLFESNILNPTKLGNFLPDTEFCLIKETDMANQTQAIQAFVEGKMVN